MYKLLQSKFIDYVHRNSFILPLQELLHPKKRRVVPTESRSTYVHVVKKFDSRGTMTLQSCSRRGKLSTLFNGITFCSFVAFGLACSQSAVGSYPMSRFLIRFPPDSSRFTSFRSDIGTGLVKGRELTYPSAGHRSSL